MVKSQADKRQLVEKLCDLEIPYEIKISPHGDKVLYSTSLTWGHRKGRHAVTTLWLATLNQEGSSRRITDSTTRDHCISWHPSKDEFVFISDRAGNGSKSAVYSVSLTDLDQPVPITPIFDQAVEKFKYSPDGQEIAFISKDEVTDQEKQREEEQGDVQIWGDHRFSRLRVVNLTNGKIRSLELAQHILDFDWNPAPQGAEAELVFVSCKDPVIETPYWHGSEIHTVKSSLENPSKLCPLSTKPNDICWARDGLIYFWAGSQPDKHFMGNCLYKIDTADPGSFSKMPLEDSYDVVSMRSSNGLVLARAQHRLDDCLYTPGKGEVYRAHRELEAYDAKTDHNGALNLAFSESDLNQPMEVYSIENDGNPVRLSNHGRSFRDHRFGSSTTLTCRTGDEHDVEIDALFLSPTAADNEKPDPLPTIVLLHGGPSARIANAFNTYYYMWAPYLLSLGYGLLLPNYRGSLGRGEKFSSFSYGGSEHQYQDTITLTQYAVAKGLADPARLVIGGISHGGLLTNICALRNGEYRHKWTFKAAVSVAGIADGDTMAVTSDMGNAYQGELNYGSVPWTMSMDDISTRKSSPLWEFKRVMDKKTEASVPPMLIIHGASDERVHVCQAWAMRRALEHYGLPFEMVIYPRQGHIFQEQKFWIDAALRVGDWVDKYIGAAS